MLIGLGIVLEPERDLPRLLPLCPVLEEGISVFKANVVVLSENKAIREVLREDEVILGFFQLNPWDPPSATVCCNLCKIIQLISLHKTIYGSLTIELTQKFANEGLLICMTLVIDYFPAR